MSKSTECCAPKSLPKPKPKSGVLTGIVQWIADCLLDVPQKTPLVALDEPYCGVELCYTKRHGISVFSKEFGCYVAYAGACEYSVSPDTQICVTPATPEQYCLVWQPRSGNGVATSEYSVRVNADGTEVPLPPDFTNDDIVAAVEAEGIVVEGNRFCSPDPFSVIFEGVVRSEDPAVPPQLFSLAVPAFLNPAVPESRVKALVTKPATTEDSIAGILTMQNELLQNICNKLEANTDKLCELIGDPLGDCPDCMPMSVKPLVTFNDGVDPYQLVVSVGGNGDIKIDAFGDYEGTPFIDCIQNALSSGSACAISWTTKNGGSGSATLEPSASTTEFPNFYNATVTASGDSGEIQTITCG